MVLEAKLQKCIQEKGINSCQMLLIYLDKELRNDSWIDQCGNHWRPWQECFHWHNNNGRLTRVDLRENQREARDSKNG